MGEIRQRVDRPLNLFVAHVIPVPAEAYPFEAAREGLPVPIAANPVHEGDLNKLTATMMAADLVFLQDSASIAQSANFPINQHLDELIDIAKKTDSLHLVEKMSGMTGTYYIFARAITR